MHIAEFTTSKFCTFNDFFHFLGLNWFLNDVKHTILVLQKQLISTKTVSIYTHFAVGGKGAQMHIFILAPWKIPTSSKQNIFSDQQRKCPKTWKHKNMLWFKRFISTADRRNMPIFCYDCLQYTMEGLNAKPQ